MSRHSKTEPKTVADLVEALGKIDQSLPVHEAWDGLAGWFEVVRVEKRHSITEEMITVDEYVVLGCYLDSCFAQMWDHRTEDPITLTRLDDDIAAFGGLTLPEDYDRESWAYGD